MVLWALETCGAARSSCPRSPATASPTWPTAIAPGCRQEVVGIRPGEKLHEEMVTETDALSTVEFEDYFVILPSLETLGCGGVQQDLRGTPLCAAALPTTAAPMSEWLTVEQIAGADPSACQLQLHASEGF